MEKNVSPHPHPSEAAGNGQAGIDHQSQSRVSTESSSGTGRLLTFAVIALMILLAIGFAIAYGVHQRTEENAEHLAIDNADAKPVVDVVAVQPCARSYPLELPGQTAGWYQSTIYARVDGYLGSWTADIGDRVKQGQVLAKIDTPEMDQQLNAAVARAAASQAQVNVAKSSVSIAKLTNDRWRESPKGVVSEQEREEKQATYEEAVARLAAAQAQAQLDEADVGRYKAMQEFKNVTAPYDGVITGRKVDVGDLVTAGSSANTTSLYSVAKSDVMRVFVDVPQKAAADTNNGLPAVVTSDQYPGRKFPGKVARSAMSMDPQTRTQKTEVDVPNPDFALVPGMYVTVTFQLNQRGLQEVPAAAMLFRSTGLQVAVVGDDGRVDFRPVTVAKDNGDTVVLASGVNSGERVALNLSSAIVPGEQVTIEQDNDGAAPPPATQATPVQAAMAAGTGVVADQRDLQTSPKPVKGSP
jgi:RND family efflux transporter MFP subunit